MIWRLPPRTLQTKPHYPVQVDGERNLSTDLSQAAPGQPGNQGSRVTVQRKHSLTQKPAIHHPPVHVSNGFSPLSDRPTEKPTPVTGSCILRNMTFSTPVATVKYIPGARLNVESNLKLLAKSKSKYSKNVIHVCGYDVQNRI